MNLNIDIHDIKKKGIKVFKLKPGENTLIENITTKTLQVIVMPVYNGVSFNDKYHFNHKKGGSKA